MPKNRQGRQVQTFDVCFRHGNYCTSFPRRPASSIGKSAGFGQTFLTKHGHRHKLQSSIVHDFSHY